MLQENTSLNPQWHYDSPNGAVLMFYYINNILYISGGGDLVKQQSLPNGARQWGLQESVKLKPQQLVDNMLQLAIFLTIILTIF